PIKIAPANRFDGKLQVPGDAFDHGLDRKHGLGTAVAAKGGIRHRIGLAGQTAEANVGKELTVVGVAKRARENRGRMIRDAAAICSQYQIEGNDSALIVETDVVTKQKRVTLAGRAHVIVAG